MRKGTPGPEVSWKGTAGRGVSRAGLTLRVHPGLRELPLGCHVLDHPRLRRPVLLRLSQRVPLHVLQVSLAWVGLPRGSLLHTASSREL